MTDIPVDTFTFGRWPGRTARIVSLGCAGTGAAVVLLIGVTAWVALFRGHPEAVLWALLPSLVVVLWWFYPSPSFRSDGVAIEVLGWRVRRTALADIVAMMPARHGLPWITLFVDGSPPLRLQCSPAAEPFIARLAALLPLRANLLPSDWKWMRRRRRTWLVLMILFGMSQG